MAMNRINGNRVPAKDVTNGVTLQPASALGLPRVISYRASGLVAVELLVAVPAGALVEREAEPDLAAAGHRSCGRRHWRPDSSRTRARGGARTPKP